MNPLTLVLLLSTYSPMSQARTYVRNEAWSEALVCLQTYKPREAEYIEYCFLRACSHCRLNQKELAIKYAEKVVDEFGLYVPRRYKAVAELIIAESESWKTDDPGDIYRDMKAVTDRLKNKQAGKETQRRQEEILKKLDKLIKAKEDAIEAAAKAAAEAKQKKQAKSQDQSIPSDDFHLPKNEKAKGEIDLKKMKEYADVWGKLPERERAKAMTELTRGLPPKYRDAIESYFRKLENKRGK